MRPYNLLRSKRKTLALYIRDDAVEARAPMRMAKAEIDRFVASKEDWIVSRLAAMRELKESRESFRVGYGSLLLCRGKPYPVLPKAGKFVEFADAFYVPPDLTTSEIKNACIQIYRLLARKIIKEKTRVFAQLMSADYASVKITGAQKQWGSCSVRKRLSFSWKLMMADDALIDYVVVHELAHIFEMNHSERFWGIVEGVLPDYTERREQLKNLQKRLSGENWQ